MAKVAACLRCQRDREIRARGLCAPCYMQEWYKAHPEANRKRMRMWRNRHLERARELNRQSQRRRDPEVRRTKQREYREKNAASYRPMAVARTRDWRRRHPEEKTAQWHRRRERLAAGGPHFTGEEWRRLKEQHAQCCAYCGTRAKLTPDHRIPLVRGGSNAIENILPACARCNSRKGGKTEDEFRERLLGGRAA